MRFTADEMLKYKLLSVIIPLLFIIAPDTNADSKALYCNFPRTYKINKYDQRFSISKGELRLALKNAANMWNQGTKKFLLKEVYTQEADIEINMIYRDAFPLYKKAHQIISKGMQITSDFKEYSRMYKNFNAEGFRLKSKGKELDVKLAKINTNISRWNNSKNKSQLRLNQLKLEQVRLKDEIEKFNIEIKDFEKNRSFMNEWFNLINIKKIEYRKQSKLLQQMQRGTLDYSLAGLYERKRNKETISLFLFNDRQSLTNVLAHEFGHALGIKHVDEKKALMFKFANNSNKKIKRISVSDYLAFVNICSKNKM